MYRNDDRVSFSHTNNLLIFMINGLFLGFSYFTWHLVMNFYGIRGLAWLWTGGIWAFLNIIISFAEIRNRQEPFFSCVFTSMAEGIMLFLLSTGFVYFINYDMSYGVGFFLIYTTMKMYSSTHPFFEATERLVYKNMTFIQEMEESGEWLSSEVIEVKPEPISPQEKSPEPEITPASPIPVQTQDQTVNGGDDRQFRLKVDRERGTVTKVKRSDAEKRQMKQEEEILRQQTQQLSGSQPSDIPEELEIQFQKMEQQFRRRQGEKFHIPLDLTRKGLDKTPRPINVKNLIQMDSREKVRVMMLSVKKDMLERFGMKIFAPTVLSITFPWEMSSADKKRKKLSEKLKAKDTWIISLTGALKDNITYAILLANLADIWFDENAHTETKIYKEGFHFWLVYKLAKYKQYYDIAVNATQQKPEEFHKIRKIEERMGEYGVFYYIVNNKYPDYSTLPPQIAPRYQEPEMFDNESLEEAPPPEDKQDKIPRQKKGRIDFVVSRKESPQQKKVEDLELEREISEGITRRRQEEEERQRREQQLREEIRRQEEERIREELRKETEEKIRKEVEERERKIAQALKEREEALEKVRKEQEEDLKKIKEMIKKQESSIAIEDQIITEKEKNLREIREQDQKAERQKQEDTANQEKITHHHPPSKSEEVNLFMEPPELFSMGHREESSEADDDFFSKMPKGKTPSKTGASKPVNQQEEDDPFFDTPKLKHRKSEAGELKTINIGEEPLQYKPLPKEPEPAPVRKIPRKEMVMIDWDAPLPKKPESEISKEPEPETPKESEPETPKEIERQKFPAETRKKEKRLGLEIRKSSDK